MNKDSLLRSRVTGGDTLGTTLQTSNLETSATHLEYAAVSEEQQLSVLTWTLQGSLVAIRCCGFDSEVTRLHNADNRHPTWIPPRPKRRNSLATSTLVECTIDGLDEAIHPQAGDRMLSFPAEHQEGTILIPLYSVGKNCGRCRGHFIPLPVRKRRRAREENHVLVCSRCLHEDSTCSSLTDPEFAMTLVHNCLGMDHHNNTRKRSFSGSNQAFPNDKSQPVATNHVSSPTMTIRQGERFQPVGHPPRRSLSHRLRRLPGIRQMFQLIASPFKSDEARRSRSLTVRDELRSVAQTLDNTTAPYVTTAGINSISDAASLERESAVLPQWSREIPQSREQTPSRYTETFQQEITRMRKPRNTPLQGAMHIGLAEAPRPLSVVNRYSSMSSSKFECWDTGTRCRTGQVTNLRAMSQNLVRSFNANETLLRVMEAASRNTPSSPVLLSPTRSMRDKSPGVMDTSPLTTNSRRPQSLSPGTDIRTGKLRVRSLKVAEGSTVLSPPLLDMPYEELASGVERINPKNLATILTLDALTEKAPVVIHGENIIQAFVGELPIGHSDTNTTGTRTPEYQVHEALKAQSLFTKTFKTTKKPSVPVDKNSPTPMTTDHTQPGPAVGSSTKDKIPVPSVFEARELSTPSHLDPAQESGASVQFFRVNRMAVPKWSRRRSGDQFCTLRIPELVHPDDTAPVECWQSLDESRKSYAQLSACLRPVQDRMPCLCREIAEALASELCMTSSGDSTSEHGVPEVPMSRSQSDQLKNAAVTDFELLAQNTHGPAQIQTDSMITNKDVVHKTDAPITFVGELKAGRPIYPEDIPFDHHPPLTTIKHQVGEISRPGADNLTGESGSLKDSIVFVPRNNLANFYSKSSSELPSLDISLTITQTRTSTTIVLQKPDGQHDRVSIVGSLDKERDGVIIGVDAAGSTTQPELSSLFSSEGKDYFHDFRVSHDTTESTSQLMYSGESIGGNENAHFVLPVPRGPEIRTLNPNGFFKTRLVVDTEVTTSLERLASLNLRFDFDNNETQTVLPRVGQLADAEHTLTVPNRSSVIAPKLLRSTDTDLTKPVPRESIRSLASNDPFFPPGHYDDRARVSHVTHSYDRTQATTLLTAATPIRSVASSKSDDKQLNMPSTVFNTKVALKPDLNGRLQISTPLVSTMNFNYRTLGGPGSVAEFNPERSDAQSVPVTEIIKPSRHATSGLHCDTKPVFHQLNSSIACAMNQTTEENQCTMQVSTAVSTLHTWPPNEQKEQEPRLTTIESISDIFSFPVCTSSGSEPCITTCRPLDTESQGNNQGAHDACTVSAVLPLPRACCHEPRVAELIGLCKRLSAVESDITLSTVLPESSTQLGFSSDSAGNHSFSKCHIADTAARFDRISSLQSDPSALNDQRPISPYENSDNTETTSSQRIRQMLVAPTSFEPVLIDLRSPFVDDLSVVEASVSKRLVHDTNRNGQTATTMRQNRSCVPVDKEDKPRVHPRFVRNPVIERNNRRSAHLVNTSFPTIRCIESDLSGPSGSLPVLPSPIGPVDYLKQYRKLENADELINESLSLITQTDTEQDTLSSVAGGTDELLRNGQRYGLPLAHCPNCSQPFLVATELAYHEKNAVEFCLTERQEASNRKTRGKS